VLVVPINEKMTYDKQNQPRALRMALFLGVICAALTYWGCDGSPTDTGPFIQISYRLEGLFAKDINLHSCHAEAILLRDDSALTTAQIMIDTATLGFWDESYRLDVTPTGTFPAGAYNLEVKDSNLMVDTLQMTVSGDFALLDLADRSNEGGDQVSLEWLESTDADGYVVATVPRYLAYSGAGYSRWISSIEATVGTIPPEAFRWSTGSDLDTGWYYVYVYAYTGTPDSTLSAKLLPVPIPGDLADNIDLESLDGRFGAVRVARRDSVEVLLQP